MVFKFLFPIIAGISIVLQGTLNRNLATQIGLASAVLLNALIFLLLSGTLWLLLKFEVIGGISGLSPKSIIGLKWWDFLPGLFGFLIVFSTPLAISYLGANLTFAAIICTQLTLSLVWDSFVNKSLPTLTSVGGVAIMIVGLIVLFSGRR